MTSSPSAPLASACRESSRVSGKFAVPGPTMMFMPSLFFRATSAICLRSATEKDGNSPVVPSTTIPSAPLCLNHARTSLNAPGSNLRFLSQGVRLATQKRVFDELPKFGAAAAVPSFAIIATAAVAPIMLITSLRVVSTGFLLQLLPFVFYRIHRSYFRAVHGPMAVRADAFRAGGAFLLNAS